MSRIDKKEIDEELSHQRDILKRLRDNYRTLEKQEVSFGLSVPPHVVSEMSRLTERIQQITERIEHLEIQSVEEDYSLAEAEYRVMVARAWEGGQLSALGGAELQLSRLKLKIPKERADQIEQEIRTELARSIFSAVSLEIIWQRLDSKNRDKFKLFYKLIKLNQREFVDMAVRSFEIVKAAPDSLFENYSMRDELSEELLRSLERNIIIAANIVFESDLDFLHQAIDYFTEQLESKGLLASQ
jgi:hypothetical protein